MLIAPKGIRDIDVESIKAEAGRAFFLVLGKRSDEKLISLIPDAENIVILETICSICREPGSFDSMDGKNVLCRGCRQMERERIAIMDVRIQER